MDKVVPEYEMFYGIPYKAYCGKCGRLLYTGGRYNAIKFARDRIKKCPDCESEVDWDDHSVQVRS